MKAILVFTVVVVTCSLWSQKIGRIDFDQIKMNISDSSSHFYYPNLLNRMWSDDSTLSQKDYQHLYYGSVFQPTYHPYGATFTKKEFNQIYATNNVDLSIDKGLDVLKENPVDLEVTLKILLLYLSKGDTFSAKIYARKYFGMLDEIYASGDGDSKESAYVVVSVDDEYRIIGDLGLSVKQQILIDDCDLLLIVKKGQKRFGGKKIKRLYFNVRLPLLSLSNSYKDIDLPRPDGVDDEDE